MEIKKKILRRKAVDAAQRSKDMPPQVIDDGVPVGVSKKQPTPNLDHKRKLAAKKTIPAKAKPKPVTPKVKIRHSKKERGEGKKSHTQPKGRIQ